MTMINDTIDRVESDQTSPDWKGETVNDLRTQFAISASRLIDEDDRVAVVLAEISADRFDDQRRRYPDRVLNVGIREQLLVSATAGLALSGLRPIAHTFGAFLIERAWEQVKLDLSHQGLGAVLVGSYGSYDWPAGGRTHQAPGDIALLDTLRDWTIQVPGHPAELDAQLRTAARGTGRVYIRVGGDPNPEPHPTADGRWTRLRDGADGIVVAVGPALRATQQAVADLDVTLLYASTIRPFDAVALRRAPGRRRVVMVEPYLAGTSAAQVATALADVDHRQLGLGVADPDPHRYGSPEDHDRLHGLDPASIRTRVDRFLRA